MSEVDSTGSRVNEWKGLKGFFEESKKARGEVMRASLSCGKREIFLPGLVKRPKRTSIPP
jgi:hypothetical protein